jgi:DNA-binding IclR family transcriptional regulator
VIPGLAAVSSPVLQWNGQAAAVVTLIGPDPEIGKANHPAAGALRRLCDRLSKDFGAKELKAVA